MDKFFRVVTGLNNTRCWEVRFWDTIILASTPWPYLTYIVGTLVQSSQNKHQIKSTGAQNMAGEECFSSFYLAKIFTANYTTVLASILSNHGQNIHELQKSGSAYCSWHSNHLNLWMFWLMVCKFVGRKKKRYAFEAIWRALMLTSELSLCCFISKSMSMSMWYNYGGRTKFKIASKMLPIHQ